MRVLAFIIYSNLLVSFSAGSIALACADKLGNPHYVGIGLIVFLSTLFTYNLQRILRLGEINPQKSSRHLWIEKNQVTLKVLSAIGLVGSVLIYFLVLGWNIDFWLLLTGAILGVLYALKTHPKGRALRDIPYLKIYLIALQWTLAVAVWPYIRIASTIDFPIALVASIFLYILAATIPFDIRDLVYDAKHKATIPQILGIKGAKTAGLILLLSSAGLLVVAFPKMVNVLWFYISFIVLGIFIIKSNKERHEMYFSGGIDGWIVTYAIAVYVV